MRDALKVAALPLVAGAIFGVSLVWWTGSWMVEGYRQVKATIRSAN